MQLSSRLSGLKTTIMAPPPARAPRPVDEADFTIKTYRYVRIMIVALTIGLLTAVFVEQGTAGCSLGSISAYYYTPARGLFTAGLLGIGVCLIAVRGENDLQDGLLNLGGLLAPMVALVPMHLSVGTADHPSREASCIANAHRLRDLRDQGAHEDPFSLVTAGRLDAIRNDTWALLIMLGLGLLLLAFLIRYARSHPRAGVRTPRWWPWWAAAGATLLIWGLYVFANGFFVERVHFGSAILMFVAISVYAVVDGIRAQKLQRAVKRGVGYVALGISLIAGCALIMLVGRLADWEYTTFTAEVWGIAVFLVFWTAQTADLWDHTSRASAILRTTTGDGPL